MVGGSLGGGGLHGDLLSLVMSTAFACVLVITRRHREISMTPATALGMVIAFVALAPFSHPGVLSARDWTMLAALGAGQIGLGMILFTAGARLIAAAQAGLITLLEVVLGPLWMWLIYREQPDGLTLVGGAVILSAVLAARRRGPAAGDAHGPFRPALSSRPSCPPVQASSRSSQLPASCRRHSRGRGAPCARSRRARRRRHARRAAYAG